MNYIFIEGRYAIRSRSGELIPCTEDWFSEPTYLAFVDRGHAAWAVKLCQLDGEVVELSSTEVNSLPLVYFVPDENPLVTLVFGGSVRWMCIGSSNAKIRPDLQPTDSR